MPTDKSLEPDGCRLGGAGDVCLQLFAQVRHDCLAGGEGDGICHNAPAVLNGDFPVVIAVAVTIDIVFVVLFFPSLLAILAVGFGFLDDLLEMRVNLAGDVFCEFVAQVVDVIIAVVTDAAGEEFVSSLEFSLATE